MLKSARNAMKKAIHNHGIFNPSPEHVYVCMFHSCRPEIRVEEDHSLYLDQHALCLFVVVAREWESGPSVSCSHNIYSLNAYVELNPTLKEKIGPALRARLTAPGGTRVA